MLQSWPARSDLPKFSGWESASLIYAPFATAIDVKCEALGSLERQQTSCKQVTEAEGNVLWLAACIRWSVVFGSAVQGSEHWFMVFMAAIFQECSVYRSVSPALQWLCPAPSVWFTAKHFLSSTPFAFCFFLFRKSDSSSVLNDDCSQTERVNNCDCNRSWNPQELIILFLVRNNFTFRWMSTASKRRRKQGRWEMEELKHNRIQYSVLLIKTKMNNLDPRAALACSRQCY